jgi:hypothetical protein
MSFYVHISYSTVRYGKAAGQQNNQHEDPILTFGYMWGDDIGTLMNQPYGQHNFQVKLTQGDKEWRGRIVFDIPNFEVSVSPTLYAHAYFFAVTPKMKKSTSLTSDTEVQVGDGAGDPGSVTVTVTNPDGSATISTTTPPTITVQPID